MLSPIFCFRFTTEYRKYIRIIYDNQSAVSVHIALNKLLQIHSKSSLLETRYVRRIHVIPFSLYMYFIVGETVVTVLALFSPIQLGHYKEKKQIVIK